MIVRMREMEGGKYRSKNQHINSQKKKVIGF